MKSILFLFIGLVGSVTILAQEEISVRVSKMSVDKDNSHICFAVEMNGALPEKQLASQNYRIFYNSDNLHFIKKLFRLFIFTFLFFIRLFLFSIATIF